MRDRKSHNGSREAAGARARPVATEKGTVSTAFVRPVLRAPGVRRARAAALLAEAGIPAAVAAARHGRVSAQQYSRLWAAFIREFDDEFFGQDSRRMKAGSFALMSRLALHSGTLGRALDRTARFLHVVLDETSVAVGQLEGRARIVVLQVGPGRSAPFAHETLLMMVHGLACWLVGRRIPISSAAFAYPAPGHWTEYATMFSPVLRFEQPQTALEFDAAYLALPVVQTEATLKTFLREGPSSILLKYKNTGGLVARIRRRLRQTLPRELPDLVTVAREFHTSPATLRRRLRAEGSSYQSVKDDLRRDLAMGYLGATGMTMLEVSQALGFLEPSAFHRAFRRWTRVSPGDFRALHANGERRPAKAPGRPGRAPA